MHYEKPEFIEIKMDAEIGSYQNDFDPGPYFAEPTEPLRREESSVQAGSLREP
jgi:hypothetical protein